MHIPPPKEPFDPSPSAPMRYGEIELADPSKKWRPLRTAAIAGGNAIVLAALVLAARMIEHKWPQTQQFIDGLLDQLMGR